MSGGSVSRSNPKPAAEIGLSARIVDKNGKVVASRLFEESEKFDHGRAAGGRRGVQRSVRPDCEEYDRMDGAGALGELEARAAARIVVTFA